MAAGDCRGRCRRVTESGAAVGLRWRGIKLNDHLEPQPGKLETRSHSRISTPESKSQVPVRVFGFRLVDEMPCEPAAVHGVSTIVQQVQLLSSHLLLHQAANGFGSGLLIYLSCIQAVDA
jgi:hypothetical protein